MKKGIYTWFGFEIPARERLVAIREAGFSAVMLNWEDGLPEMRHKEGYADLARKLKLEIVNGHLPYEGANDLWRDGLDGDDWIVPDSEHPLRGALRRSRTRSARRARNHAAAAFPDWLHTLSATKRRRRAGKRRPRH